MRFLLRNSLFVAAGYAAWSATVLPPARACSFAPQTEHVIDPAEEAADAHRLLESRQTSGKLLLIP